MANPFGSYEEYETNNHSFDSFGSASTEGYIKKWPYQLIEPSVQPIQDFDPEILPDAFKKMVYDVAHRMQSPLEYAAVVIMVQLSAIVGGKYGIHPKQKDDWIVTPNLWGLLIGRPSMKKTPSMNAVLWAINDLERRAGEKYEEEMKAFNVEERFLKAKEKEVNAEVKALIKEGKEDQAREKIAALEASRTPAPIRKRYTTNDGTAEKIGDILQDNPNGLIVVRDEIAGLLEGMKKQGREQEKAFYLESWSGSQGFIVDRIGRGTIEVPSLIISLIGGIQPAKLAPYIYDAMNNGAGDDGFIQRFQLMVCPDKVKVNWVDQLPDDAARTKAKRVFERIDAIENSEQVKLRFAQDAQPYFIQWAEEMEQKKEAEGLPDAIQSHIDKYASLIPSLALIIDIADNDGAHDVVSKRSLFKALEWSDFLESHMYRVYGMAETMEVTNAINIAKRFATTQTGKEKKLIESFTLRDIARGNWSGIGKDRKKALAAIEVLIDHGYVKEDVRPSATGRPTTDYIINESVIGAHYG